MTSVKSKMKKINQKFFYSNTEKRDINQYLEKNKKSYGFQIEREKKLVGEN